MPTDLPKEINDAIDLLWEYSTDACLSSGTKEEIEADGYECKGESAHFITFVIERNGAIPEKKVALKEPVKYECKDCIFYGVNPLICSETYGYGSECDIFAKL